MEVSGQLHAPAALPLGKEPLVPTEYEAGWDPEPVWTWWREKFPAPTGTQTPKSSSPYQYITELPRLLFECVSQSLLGGM